MADCKNDMLVKTKTGRIVMVGDVIKTLRACAESAGCAECDCESIEDCANYQFELVELAADVLEIFVED